MLYFGGLFGLLILGLWAFCLVDIVTTDEDACRHLPKLLWLLLVLLVPLAGSIVWLLAGRPASSVRQPGTMSPPVPGDTAYDRPGRFAAAAPPRAEAILGLRGGRYRA